MLWTDNMQVPVGAPHAYTAEVYMNYVYDPEVQAKITAYVNYVPPVKGVQEIIRKDDPKLAESPLVFPDAQVLSRAKIFKNLTPEQENTLNTAFQKVIGA
jgi:spermidine/putrescine transport system substrate-binding protein